LLAFVNELCGGGGHDRYPSIQSRRIDKYAAPRPQFQGPLFGRSRAPDPLDRAILRAMSDLSHLDERGQARMVDVGNKNVTARSAVARAEVAMQPGTLALLLTAGAEKGDVIAAARIAGIMAAKKTPELIPLCHTVALSKVELAFEPDEAQSRLEI